MMFLQEIVHEIEQSMDFLSTTGRDVPQRHRSMRAVFGHSWNLLSDEEQQVMQILADGGHCSNRRRLCQGT